MEQYDAFLRDVQQVVEDAAPALTDAERAAIEHLIDHDEPGEGLRTLAWIIVEENKRVAQSVIAAIGRLSDGLVDDMPPNLAAHAVEPE